MRGINRDGRTNHLNTYLSAIGNKQNEVMRMLTIMASIFIPLTFMAAVYGMNFEAMPELKHPSAYPILLFGMFATATGMLICFKRLGWIWAGKKRQRPVWSTGWDVGLSEFRCGQAA